MAAPRFQLAMPLFAAPSPISSDAILGSWSRLFAGGPRLEVTSSKEGVHAFRIDGRDAFVSSMPVPVPNDEALGAVRMSWMWQGPDGPVRQHRAHAIVASGDAPTPVQGALDVARLSAAVLVAGSGVALYWGNSRQVHDARVAVEFAAEASSLPVPLWVGITLSGPSAQGPFSAATHGLEALGHKELEVVSTRMGIGELRMTLLDVASYVLKAGPVLLDGQTFGPSADVRWSVRHTRSQLVEGREVITLGIP